MLLFFAVLLVSNAIQQAPKFLQEKFGINIGTYLVASAALSSDTPLDTRVSAVNGGICYKEVQKESATCGEFPPGASLVLRDGPETGPEGERWWYVEDPATGKGGWVPEGALVRESAGGVGSSTKKGSKARALLATTLWRLPGGGEKVADMKKGDSGMLADGPQESRGARWWFFDRDGTKDDGWVPESALVLASDNDWHSGSLVRATHDIDLFERAGGGRALASIVEGASLTVAGGPVALGGAYWWLVEEEAGTQGWVPESALEDGGFRGWARGVIAVVLVIAVVITVLLLGGIVYATIRTSQIRVRETKRIRDAIPKTMEPKRNERWDQVLAHANSENPSEWRLAIIEADIILDELVTRMGYLGMTLGDKLKQATRGDFKTIDNAWEAHRVRNQIAHEGSDFILTKHEARRVIALYESVLEEFKYS